MATSGEPSFHLLGFCLEIAATCSRALKSVVQVRGPLALPVCVVGGLAQSIHRITGVESHEAQALRA